MSIMIIVAAIAYKVVSTFSSPYIESTVGTIIIVLREEGLYKAVGTVVNGFLKNIQTMSWFHIINQDSDILQFYFLEYVIIIISLSCKAIKRIKDKTIPLWNGFLDDNCMIALVMLLGFLIGYCVLYTGSDSTLCRGTNTALIMSFCILSLDDEIKYSKPDEMKLDIRKAILIITFLGSISIWNYYHAIVSERDWASMRIELIDSEKSSLSNYIKITEEAGSAWDNTIACYGAVDNLFLAIPDGAGLNYMISNANNELARYVLLRTSGEMSKELMRMLRDSGHREIYSDEIFTVLEKEADRSAYGP